MNEETFSRLLASVSEQRREKVLRFKFESGRRQSLMAYVLLRELLHEHYAIDGNPVFTEGENGKPVITGIEGSPGLSVFPFFNMSHTHNAVAVAVSDRPIGIDIECFPKDVKPDLCHYVFNDIECDSVLSSPTPEIEFARLWTMKEATVKLSGEGIKGKDQLRSLLQDMDNVSFHTIVNEKCGYVLTIAEPLTSNLSLCV